MSFQDSHKGTTENYLKIKFGAVTNTKGVKLKNELMSQ